VLALFAAVFTTVTLLFFRSDHRKISWS
jgi:hypothetical protein